MSENNSIQSTLFDYFKDTEMFTLQEATNITHKIKNEKIKDHSIRARIYEGIDKGLFVRVRKGIYTVTKNENTCMLINGDGRDLSFLEDNSIDAIITDHPYLDETSHKGGNRSFADYTCFKYNQSDFDEKQRVLKKGGFLCEFLPEENENNFEYLYQIKQMAINSGFQYYAKVPWQKLGKTSNTGRKRKQMEDVMIFSNGPARKLNLNAKANYAKLREFGHYRKGMNSLEAKAKLEEIGLEVNYMSGARMLPALFEFHRVEEQEQIHQAEKPVELIESIIDFVTLPNETVLDSFAGSGVVGEAALNMGRNAICIELDESIFSTMVNRYKAIENSELELIQLDEIDSGYHFFALKEYGYLSQLDINNNKIRYSSDINKAIPINDEDLLRVEAFLHKNRIQYSIFLENDIEDELEF